MKWRRRQQQLRMSSRANCHRMYRFSSLTETDVSGLFHQSHRERKKKLSFNGRGTEKCTFFVDWSSRGQITDTSATRLRGRSGAKESKSGQQKKIHRQTERCNEVCVPILLPSESRRKSSTKTRHRVFLQATQIRLASQRVAMLHALTQSRSTPTKGTSEKGRGRGKGKGKGKGTGTGTGTGKGQGRGPAGMSTMG